MRVIKNTALVFGATVGVLVVFGLLLGWVSGYCDRLLLSVFGWGGILFTGLVGTPVHEFGHWLMCKVFGFQVLDVSLFRPIAGRTDGVLGYVYYSYQPDNLWQQLGTFFVGIAPMVVGVLVIALVVRVLTPGVYRSTREKVRAAGKTPGLGRLPKLWWAGLSGFWAGIRSLRGVGGVVRGAVCLYLVCSISMHMTLSPADLQGAMTGILMVCALCLVFGVVTAVCKDNVEPLLTGIATTTAAFLSIGLIFCGFFTLLASGFKLLTQAFL